MNHPYTKHEGTETWGVIKKSLRALIENNDLTLETSENHVIGYFCQQLFNKYQSRWFAKEQIEGVKLYLGDSIIIVDEENAGIKGSILSLEVMEPEPMYFVELSGGDSVLVKQSSVEHL